MAEHFEHKKVSQMCGRRLTYLSAGKAEIEDVSLPEPREGEVLIRTHYSGMSRGTETLVFNGLVPASEHDRMRCPYMAGSFEFPVSYGYCCVGEVEKLGASISGLNVGDRVFVLHPHQSRFIVSADSCNLLPADLPTERAVLSANMETGLNAVWDAELKENNSGNIAITGAGVVGLLTAHAIQEICGIVPAVFDVDPAKRELVEKMGFGFRNPTKPEEISDDQFDYVFHTSATSGGLQTAIDLCGFEGTVIELSWYGSNAVSINLGGAFHSHRLTIKSSQVGAVAQSKRGTLDFSDRMQQAMALLCSSKLDHLLESAIDFEDLPGHLLDILKPGGKHLCQLVRYS